MPQKDRAYYESILSDVRYKDWRFAVRFDEFGIYLQVRFEADGQPWGGRKWRLAPHMAKSEVVQTALKAVLTAEEHEAREHFLYRGRAVFGPHIHIDALWEACELNDMRPTTEDRQLAPWEAYGEGE